MIILDHIRPLTRRISCIQKSKRGITSAGKERARHSEMIPISIFKS